jgi:pimeloyl-ACP methyl ester carboxylesterase
MRRGWKILIAVVAVLAVLIGVNAVVVSDETKSAEVNEPGGRILKLPGGEMQVVEHGPRGAPPIVLIHCFTCAINWWDGMIPRLDREHRVIAVDLLGHGGSEKPSSGYSIEDQADLVAQALARLGVRDAEVVGHSLGGPVSIALAERSPQLVDRLVAIDSIPDDSYGDVGLIGELPFKPVIGQTLWRIKPDFSIEDGLGVAFAPGFDVPDAFVEDVKRMTYSSYTGSHDAFDDYTGEKPLPQRAAATGKPILAIMGAEEQIAKDPRAVLAAYRAAGAQTKLIQGAGHSPNVEKPAQTAALVLAFERPARHELQKAVQKSKRVRKRP